MWYCRSSQASHFSFSEARSSPVSFSRCRRMTLILARATRDLPLLRFLALNLGSRFRKFRSEGFARRDQSSLVRIQRRRFQLLDSFLHFDGVCAKDESHD